MVAPGLEIRPARPDEGHELTELALRAKGQWEYDHDFLEAARTDLTIDADVIRVAEIRVLERDGTMIGFHGLLGEPPRGRLEWMFIDPGSIGSGYGRLLWNDALACARLAGFTRLQIESDRFAEQFYLQMGAERVGSLASSVDGAPLPLLEIQVPLSAA